MQPLQITCKLATGLAMHHPLAIDGLLAAMVAARDSYPPIALEERIPPPEALPLAWHPAGFHHASQAHLVIQAYETVRWSRTLLPIHRLALLTDRGKFPVGGRFKAYWMPLRKVLPAGMVLTWWVMGDAQGIRELLRHTFGLGAKHNAGHGWVASWTVEPWADDWSLLRPGDEGPEPTRPLPMELAPEGWQGLEVRRLTYPYWRRDGQVLAAVPMRVENK